MVLKARTKSGLNVIDYKLHELSLKHVKFVGKDILNKNNLSKETFCKRLFINDESKYIEEMSSYIKTTKLKGKKVQARDLKIS